MFSDSKSVLTAMKASNSRSCFYIILRIKDMIVKLRKEKNAEMKLILISEIFKDNKKVDKLAKNEIHTRIDTNWNSDI